MTEARTYPVRPFLAASVAVLREGRVLVAARGKPPLRGVFTLPGGLVEAGETLAEAALRELAEETGIRARMIGFVGPVELIERDGAGAARHHFVICAHVARWLSGEGEPGEEATDVRWVRPDELATLPTTSGLADIVRRAVALAAQTGG